MISKPRKALIKLWKKLQLDEDNSDDSNDYESSVDSIEEIIHK